MKMVIERLKHLLSPTSEFVRHAFGICIAGPKLAFKPAIAAQESLPILIFLQLPEMRSLPGGHLVPMITLQAPKAFKA
tara:strand:+ start:340 stop:573 length:234 start_codon:yes stop_codon:yes gene_type:complete